jgi:predicted nuclease with TOPRIM domain
MSAQLIALLPALIAAVLALAGTGGVIFVALRHNRDEAGKIVTQQTSVLSNMQALNDELSDALDRARNESDRFRAERDELMACVTGCRDEIKALRVEVTRLHSLMDTHNVPYDGVDRRKKSES